MTVNFKLSFTDRKLTVASVRKLTISSVRKLTVRSVRKLTCPYSTQYFIIINVVA